MYRIGDYMTPDELASDLWGDTLPQYQYEVNREWLNEVFRMLKIGGIWAWPEPMRLFRKETDTLFMEVEVSDP